MELTLSKHRVEGLTDGIFAIVMTLLVLELKAPELERHAANAEIVSKLLTLGPQLLAFFLTFVLCGLFWFLHHSSTHFIRHMTGPLILVNLLFLMFVSLLPFSAAMLGRFLHAPIALEIYYAHQFVLGTLLGVQWEYVRRRRLFIDAITAPVLARMLFRLWALPSACMAAFLTAVIQPEWAQTVFALALVAGRLIGRSRERAASVAAAQ